MEIRSVVHSFVSHSFWFVAKGENALCERTTPTCQTCRTGHPSGNERWESERQTCAVQKWMCLHASAMIKIYVFWCRLIFLSLFFRSQSIENGIQKRLPRVHSADNPDVPDCRICARSWIGVQRYLLPGQHAKRIQVYLRDFCRWRTKLFSN